MPNVVEQINSMGIRTGITTIEDVEEKSTKKEGLEPKP